jgi:hypothetical protein
MNDDRRKLLTNYLGECWHKWEDRSAITDFRPHRCIKCGFETMQVFLYHTFLDPMDMDALRRKLMENSDWDNFLDFCENTFAKADHPCICDFCQEYIGWLMDPERFSMLVAEWLEEKNNG